MKRILALIMSLAMLFSATELSFSVNAAGNSRTTMDEDEEPDVEGAAGVYYSAIMTRTNNGTYGRQFNTWYSGWYTSMDRIEPIVRLIYAEAPWWLADKQATAWVLWNRKQSTESRFASVNTLYDVAVQPWQFTTITGDSVATNVARKPDVTLASWRNSANYVSMIWAAMIEESTPSGLLPVPTGYTGQLDFRAYSSFFVENPTYTQNYAFTRNGVPYYHMYNSETGTASEARIYHICIPGVGVYESIAAAKDAYYTKYDNIDGEKVNIYFSWNNY